MAKEKILEHHSKQQNLTMKQKYILDYTLEQQTNEVVPLDDTISTKAQLINEDIEYLNKKSIQTTLLTKKLDSLNEKYTKIAAQRKSLEQTSIQLKFSIKNRLKNHHSVDAIDNSPLQLEIQQLNDYLLKLNKKEISNKKLHTKKKKEALSYNNIL